MNLMNLSLICICMISKYSPWYHHKVQPLMLVIVCQAKTWLSVDANTWPWNVYCFKWSQSLILFVYNTLICTCAPCDFSNKLTKFHSLSQMANLLSVLGHLVCGFVNDHTSTSLRQELNKFIYNLSLLLLGDSNISIYYFLWR